MIAASPWVLAALLVPLAPAPAPAPVPAPTPLTLERIFSDPPLGGRPPQQVALAPDGSRVTFLQPNEQDSEVLDLWGIDLPDGKPRRLVAASDLLGGGTQKLSESERMALERKRISERGITGYTFCGKSGDTLLFPFSGDLYRVTLAATPQVDRLTRSESEPEMAPVCSKDGKRVAYVRNGDVFAFDVTKHREKRLTKEAGEARTFGLAEFIAEEEMDRHEGMWFAPDGRTLLVFEVDEREVGVKVRPQIFADRTEMYSQRYPAAGERNARVVPWLIETDTGRRRRVEIPNEDGYLPRAGYFPGGQPWLQWQSRDQRRLVLSEVGADGKLRTVLEETDASWVELNDDLRALDEAGAQLLWTSEASGQRQIERVDRATGRREPLTRGAEAVVHVAGWHPASNTVYYIGYTDRGRKQHLFALRPGEAPRDLTPDAGIVEATFDDTGRFYVAKQSRLGEPPQTIVREAATGRELAVLERPDPRELVAARAGEPPRFLDVTADDGTVLNALLFSPQRRVPGRKAPVIVHVYGGPTGQTAIDAWTRDYPLFLRWTQLGYGVFLVDNRGTAGRGRAFARAFREAFGVVDVGDLFRGIETLKRIDWVDPGAIGVFGWSYGGSLAARALLDEKSPFACGVSVAPVTDWRLYDTHYTERYLGQPGSGEKPAPAYAAADLRARAGLLTRPLLLVHGTADDNVLFENSLRLIEALQQQGRIFELAIYPGKAHGISGKTSRLHLYRTVESFFERRIGQGLSAAR